jgi:hypothetical protein
MVSRAAALVAEIIDRIEDRRYGTGRPPLPTIEVVETLRFFVREGVQWRELRAAAGRACGSTLRRRLDGWSATALLHQVHVALIRMVRSGPEAASWDVVVDSCSVRAKRGGELTGPNLNHSLGRLRAWFGASAGRARGWRRQRGDWGWLLRVTGSVGARCPAAQGGLAAQVARNVKLSR